MTEEPFEAFHFLYSVSRRNLSGIARRSSSRTSTLTYFHNTIKSALARANDPDTFLKWFEKALDLDFSQNYDDPLPTSEAFATMFSELKQHGTIAFMPALIQRVRERKAASEDKGEEA
jgi:hypothetical protein